MDEAKSRIYSISENGKYSVIVYIYGELIMQLRLNLVCLTLYYEIIDRYLDKKKRYVFISY